MASFTHTDAAAADVAENLPPLYTDGHATVCFTTGNGSTVGADCAAVVTGEIAQARANLLVQAYNFTEPGIVAALPTRSRCRSVSIPT